VLLHDWLPFLFSAIIIIGLQNIVRLIVCCSGQSDVINDVFSISLVSSFTDRLNTVAFWQNKIGMNFSNIAVASR